MAHSQIKLFGQSAMVQALLCASAYALAATPAGAQTASEGQADDIIVTARRVEERGQSVPVAITALSQSELDERGIERASDLMAAVPGLFVAPGSNRGNDSPVFAVRGQLNREPALTNDPSVGFYFADVPWARPGGANASFVDLQSVQVLKGPQGTLFGRNSTAGAILLTPNAPTDSLEGYLRMGLGDFDLFTSEAVANIPLGDSAAIRLVGNYQSRDGYLTAANSGQVTNDVNNYSLRASLRWEPTDSFVSTFIGTYYESDTAGDGSRLIRISPAAPAANIAPVYARFPGALAATEALGRYEFLTSFSPDVYNQLSMGVPGALGTSLSASVRTWSAQNNTSWHLGETFLGDITIKNIASYREETDGNAFSTIAVDFLTADSVSRQEVSQVTEELQLQGEASNLSYVAGLFYFREEGHDRSRSYVLAPFNRLTDNDVRNTSHSAFVHADYDFSSLGLEGVSLAGGVRVTRDDRYWNGRNRIQTTPGESATPLYTCNLQPAVPANDGSLCQYPARVRFTELTWNANLSYQASEGALLYGSVSRGYRSGGFSVAAGTPAAAQPYLPETVLNYEIGAKTDFTLGDMPTRLNLAAFYTDYEDIQRSVNLIENGILRGNVTINAAAAHIVGAEGEFRIRPLRGLDLSVSYTHLEPAYDTFVDQFREPTNGLFYPVDVSDSEFILVSRHSVSAAVSYDLPVPSSFGDPSLTASYYYRSSFFTTSDINTARCSVPGNPNPGAIYANCYNRLGRLPGYGLLNLRLDWRNLGGGGLDAAIFVNNVTDEYYYPNALNALSSFGAISAQIGPPRMFGVELTARFDSFQ